MQDTNILFFVLGSLDFVSRFGPVSLVVKKSKRTQHERRERERERERDKKKLWVQGLYCVHSKGVLASASFAP